jgi:hypothetical protein
MRLLLTKILSLLTLFSCTTLFAQGFTHEESYLKLPLSHRVELAKAEAETLTSDSFEAPEPVGANANSEIKAKLQRLRAERGLSSSRASSSPVPLLGRNFQGNTTANGTPNDNSMAISNAGVVVSVVNTNVRIYDSTGKQLLAKQLSSLANSLGTLSRPFDPRAIYDPIADRFIIVFLNGTTHEVNTPIVCFTQTNDPLGAWNCYKLPGNPLAGDTTWSDYPIVSISKDELFMTFNLLKDSMDWRVGFTRSIIWQIPKAEGYAGTDLNSKLYSEIKYDGRYVWSICPVHGADVLQSPNMYFVSVRPDAEQNDTLFLHEITNTIASGAATLNQKVLVTNVKYGVPPNGDQPPVNDSIGNYLSTNDARILDATYRDNVIHFAGNTLDRENLRAGIHIGRITDPSGNAQASGQIYSDPALDFGYPSIVALPAGLIMTFSHTSRTAFPGTSAAYFSDIAGYVDRIIVKSGTAPVNLLGDSVERWGDYTGLQARYNDLNTAWLSGSFGIKTFSASTHQTWIGEVRINTNDVAMPKLELARQMSFPNPSSGLIHLGTNGREMKTVSFVNTLGAVIETLPMMLVDGAALDLSDQPNGVYHITLHFTDGTQETQKIVLDR